MAAAAINCLRRQPDIASRALAGLEEARTDPVADVRFEVDFVLDHV